MARHGGHVGRSRRGPPAAPSKPAVSSAPITVHVDSVSAAGTGRAVADIDGAATTLDIPYVLAGETVEVRPARARRDRVEADLVRVLMPAPGRRQPPCRHFGACGGCAVQHWPDDAYARWKAEAPALSLRGRGLQAQRTTPMARTAPGMRRRADFTLKHTSRGAVVGFARRATHEIIDLGECPVLMPQIVALIAKLRELVPAALPPGVTAEAVVNWTDTGADLLLVPEDRLPLDLDRRMALAAFAGMTDAARVSWGSRRGAEPVVTRRAPRLRLGQVDVEPPPGTFLQASLGSEAALQAAVRGWLGSAKRIVDLYAGIGTLSLGMLPDRRVTLVEGDRAAVAAVDIALRKAALSGMATATARDLARDPLSAEELKPFDAAIFDPPRAGAAAQAAELARSPVPTVIAVSCDVISFARDARMLVDGGYRLEQLMPVDQFLWSPHVELAAMFRR